MSNNLISREELNRLYSILDQAPVTFRTVAEQFTNNFEENRKFELCCVLILLLENAQFRRLDSRFLNTVQKLHAYFIVYDLYKDVGITENPFLPFFLKIVEIIPGPQCVDNLESKIECYFVTQLLFQKADSIEVGTPSIFISNYKAYEPSEPPDFSVLKEESKKKRPTTLAPLRCVGIHPVIRERPSFIPSRTPTDPLARFVSEINIKEELTLQCFEPEFPREPPRLLPIDQQEMEWIYPDLPLNLVWDDSMVATLDADEVENLIAVALQQPISEQEEERLLLNLKENASDLKLTPEQLPDLIKYNPNIAFECLLNLCKTKEINGFFNTLAQMDMSVHQVGLHSMEVVNRLINSTPIPKEFLHLYIANCIRSCESITDPFFQTRLVRLVCVFLQSLIRSHIIDIDEVFIEIQAFCIEFSRIREAAGLFKLLRHLQQGDVQAEDPVEI